MSVYRRKLPPKHMRCQVCGDYADARTPGVIACAGIRAHLRCLLRKRTNRKRLTPAQVFRIFGKGFYFPD